MCFKQNPTREFIYVCMYVCMHKGEKKQNKTKGKEIILKKYVELPSL